MTAYHTGGETGSGSASLKLGNHHINGKDACAFSMLQIPQLPVAFSGTLQTMDTEKLMNRSNNEIYNAIFLSVPNP